MGFFGPPPPFTGATTTNAGASGLVPAPESGRNVRFLSSNSNFIEPFPLPKYKNTSDIITTMSGGGGVSIYAAQSPTLNQRIFTLIQVPSDGDIDEFVFRTSNAPSPAYNVHIGFWLVGEDGQPSTILGGATASTGTSVSTDVVVSVSSFSVKTGLYYMSITPDSTGTASSLRANSTNSTLNIRRVFGSTNLETTNGSVFFYVCATSYSQTTHEAFSLSTSLLCPLLGFRYA